MIYEQKNPEILDACIKCSACTAMCPVAAVNPLFPGPKSVGPDAERFRLEGIAFATTPLSYCSGCKTCEVTCPSGVKITDMILRAREKAKKSGGEQGGKNLQPAIRDFLLGCAEYLGKLATIWPNLTNVLLGSSLVRNILEQVLGISSKAPLPAYSPRFKRTRRNGKTKKQVVYFPGCFIKYNDLHTGQAIVKILEHNGYEVIIPSFHCCGTPLEGNSLFKEARENKMKNLALMYPHTQEGTPVITGCTSCGLALKEYPNFETPGAFHQELQIYDLFEFLWKLHEHNELRIDFNEVKASLGYHSACHLKAQGIGTPAVRLLRLIPGVQVADLDQGCCGLSGSYAFKKEKYDYAMQIGNPLFSRIRQGVHSGEFQAVTTECGGCQVQIRHGSGATAKHPVWLLMRAYGLD